MKIFWTYIRKIVDEKDKSDNLFTNSIEIYKKDKLKYNYVKKKKSDKISMLEIIISS